MLCSLLEKVPQDLEGLYWSVAERYPAKVTPYYAELIQKVGGPLWRQAVPDPLELQDLSSEADPLAEEQYSPVPGVVHRYPDRVLLLVTTDCPVFCRFCTRKRRSANGGSMDLRWLEDGFRYIEQNHQIKDLLISGGDPFMLADSQLESILGRLKAIPHLQFVRIGTRTPCTWPSRITTKTTEMLRQFAPLYINTHFNHPSELTAQAKSVCNMLVDNGIPMANQTVLLKGVNDDPAVLSELFRGLLTMRVRPYYLHMMDLTQGTAHFRVTLKRAQEIYSTLQGNLSGMALPKLMLDLPGGGGKVPVNPDYVVSQQADGYIIHNYEGKPFFYPEIESLSEGER